MATDKITADGQVIEAFPDLRFRVHLDDGRDVTCYTAGKMRLHKIRVVIGDRVTVELDPYKGTASNRLIKRL
jgi:translation initiation factor IF-1